MSLNRKAVVAGVAAGFIAIGSAAYAAPAPPYTVTAGSHVGDTPFSAATDAPISFTVWSSSYGVPVPMDCDSVQADGTLHVGSNINPVATIDAMNSTWAVCKGPAGLNMTVHPQSDWEVWGTGAASAAATDVVSGLITGTAGGELEAHVVSSSPDDCAFTVKGRAGGDFDENLTAQGTQQLRVDEVGFTGNLYVSDVDPSSTTPSGFADCFGLISVADLADFEGSFNVGESGDPSTPFPINLS